MSEGKDSAAVVDPNPRSPHKWTPRRKKKKRKRKAALFTKKKVRTTTSNLRIPKQQRRKLYRDRCKQKKLLIAQGVIDDGTRMPPIDHEHLEANYPFITSENDDENQNNGETNNDACTNAPNYNNTQQQQQTANPRRYPLRSRTSNTLSSSSIKQERISRTRARNHDDDGDNHTETVSNIKAEDHAIKAELNHDIKTECNMKCEGIDTSTLPTLGHFNANECAQVKADDALYEPAQKRIKLDPQHAEHTAISTLGVMNDNSHPQTANAIDLGPLFRMELSRNPININLNTTQPIHYGASSIGCGPQQQNANYVPVYGNILNSSMNHNANHNTTNAHALQMLASVALALQQDQSNNNAP
eukprot:275678_1